jgi:uncharacterized protein YqhQ
MLRYLKHFVFGATSWALGSSEDVQSDGTRDVTGGDILVGGQAVLEGVMMRSPKGYSVAVRKKDGTFRIVKDALQTAGQKWPAFKLPILRGVGVLGQALVLGIKALQFSAEEAIGDIEAESAKTSEPGVGAAPENGSALKKTSPWFIAGNLVLALGVNILMFVVLPLFATRLLQKQIGFESSLLFNAIDGAFRVTMFVSFLLLVSQLKDMRRVFEYHGAEHKTVYNFEARQDLNVTNASRFSTLHPRCGTSFLLVVMIVSIAVFSVARFDSIFMKLISRIILMPLVAGISYEIIRFSAKHPKGLLRWVTFPGLLLQKITTKEPDTAQLETAIRALEEALTV